ncbi:MAG TPA: Gfo/Idh/MocA family oxidoreductase [Victivallales bacterium]|nr:Gfo/Idh/MocA family oxidoreductase [Victivallales bacterium]
MNENVNLNKRNFALIGAAGYIAPRHMKAIKETNNELIAIVDPHDSVGIVDCYFPRANFFTEIERFDRYLEKLRRNSNTKNVEYISICSPNYLHDAHVRLALRLHANAICEKPLVINPWNLDALEEFEQEYKSKIYTILQLRYLPAILEIKKSLFMQKNNNEKKKVELSYITRRGNWYETSWKGNESKSGGLVMNIGIHFFDLLIWLFGKVINFKITFKSNYKLRGYLELENANVNWFLSIDENDLPKESKLHEKFAYRQLKISDKKIDLSSGFSELHTKAYQEILAGNGYGISDVKESIKLVYDIRNTDIKHLI